MYVELLFEVWSMRSIPLQHHVTVYKVQWCNMLLIRPITVGWTPSLYDQCIGFFNTTHWTNCFTSHSKNTPIRVTYATVSKGITNKVFWHQTANHDHDSLINEFRSCFAILRKAIYTINSNVLSQTKTVKCMMPVTCFAKNILSIRLSWTTAPEGSSPACHLNRKINPWTGLKKEEETIWYI